MIKLLALEEVAEVNPRIPKDIFKNLDKKVSFLPMASVSEDGVISNTEDRLLKDVMRGYTYFQAGDVLLAKITPCFENGKAAVVEGLPYDIGFGSTEFHVIRPGKNLDARYLYYLLWNSSFRFIGEKNMTGTAGQKRVPADFVKRYKIPLPPLSDQKRIAAILEKVGIIRRNLKQAIKLAYEFLRAIFLDMFGDPVKNSKGWNVTSAGELMTFLTSGSRGWAKYYSEDGALFLRIQNIGKNELILKDVACVNPPQSAESRRTKVQPDDVILSITADLGRTAVIPKGFPDAYINQHLAILRFTGVEPLYVSAFLASIGGQRQIKRLNREGVKAGLNFENIRSFEMMLPPISLQKKWVEIYKKVLKRIEKARAAILFDEQLFNSLSQSAFRGQL